jgi:hypothetical protein
MVGARSSQIVWRASVSVSSTRPGLPAAGLARTSQVSMVVIVAVARFADTLTGPAISMLGTDTSTWRGQPLVWAMTKRLAAP